MNYIPQQTDQSIVPPPPWPANYENETYGGHADLRFPRLSTRHPLISPAWKVVQQVEDENIADQARGILLIIGEAISIFQSQGFNLDYLPYLRASKVQDGSILIEWIFDDFRIGFSIEPASEESSWYLVSSSKLGEISASGYIPQSQYDNICLIGWLLNFALLPS